MKMQHAWYSMANFDIELKEYASLEEDWDCYGASPIDPKAIYETREFLKNLKKSPTYISPDPNGTISIIWDIDNFYMDVTVYPEFCFYATSEIGEYDGNSLEKFIEFYNSIPE